MTAPRISIALLTRNGEATLPDLLDAVWRQKSSMPIEIVAVDSGSTDGTKEILSGRVQTVIDIEPSTFNHGGTRNLAASHTSGDFIVFLVQDAVPVSDDWLTNLLAPLLADADVAGTFARQLPRPDASALTKYYLAKSPGAGAQGWTSAVGGEVEWRALSSHERFIRCVFDNVCSCVRRSLWAAHPFAETPIAEDVEWARDVLMAGHRIVYAPEACVVHSHERSALYEYRRTYALHRRLWELFDLRTIPTWPLLGRAMASSLATHLWCERARPGAWLRATALAVAWPAGQYFGARSAVRRRPPPNWRPGSI